MAAFKFPKSVPLPAEAIVTYSIISDFDPVLPPANNPLVGSPEGPLKGPYREAVKSPKSVASPVQAKVR